MSLTKTAVMQQFRSLSRLSTSLERKINASYFLLYWYPFPMGYALTLGERFAHDLPHWRPAEKGRAGWWPTLTSGAFFLRDVLSLPPFTLSLTHTKEKLLVIPKTIFTVIKTYKTCLQTANKKRTIFLTPWGRASPYDVAHVNVV